MVRRGALLKQLLTLRETLDKLHQDNRRSNAGWADDHGKSRPNSLRWISLTFPSTRSLALIDYAVAPKEHWPQDAFVLNAVHRPLNAIAAACRRHVLVASLASTARLLRPASLCLQALSCRTYGMVKPWESNERNPGKRSRRLSGSTKAPEAYYLQRVSFKLPTR